MSDRNRTEDGFVIVDALRESVDIKPTNAREVAREVFADLCTYVASMSAAEVVNTAIFAWQPAMQTLCEEDRHRELVGLHQFVLDAIAAAGWYLVRNNQGIRHGMLCDLVNPDGPARMLRVGLRPVDEA